MTCRLESFAYIIIINENRYLINIISKIQLNSILKFDPQISNNQSSNHSLFKISPKNNLRWEFSTKNTEWRWLENEKTKSLLWNTFKHFKTFVDFILKQRIFFISLINHLRHMKKHQYFYFSVFLDHLHIRFIIKSEDWWRRFFYFLNLLNINFWE